MWGSPSQHPGHHSEEEDSKGLLGRRGAYLSEGMALGNLVGGLRDRELRRAKQLGIS